MRWNGCGTRGNVTRNTLGAEFTAALVLSPRCFLILGGAGGSGRHDSSELWES